MTTSILAWYNDIGRVSLPPLSGYHLALSYTLLTNSSPLPSYPALDVASQQLRHVLLSWRKAEPDTAPKQLVYHLRHNYPINAMNAASLVGNDANAIEFLAPLAKELHFCLSLIRLSVYDTPVNVYATVDLCGEGANASDVSIHQGDIIAPINNDSVASEDCQPDGVKVSSPTCFPVGSRQNLPVYLVWIGRSIIVSIIPSVVGALCTESVS